MRTKVMMWMGLASLLACNAVDPQVADQEAHGEPAPVPPGPALPLANRRLDNGVPAPAGRVAVASLGNRYATSWTTLEGGVDGPVGRVWFRAMSSDGTRDQPARQLWSSPLVRPGAESFTALKMVAGTRGYGVLIYSWDTGVRLLVVDEDGNLLANVGRDAFAFQGYHLTHDRAGYQVWLDSGGSLEVVTVTEDGDSTNRMVPSYPRCARLLGVEQGAQPVLLWDNSGLRLEVLEPETLAVASSVELVAGPVDGTTEELVGILQQGWAMTVVTGLRRPLDQPGRVGLRQRVVVAGNAVSEVPTALEDGSAWNRSSGAVASNGYNTVVAWGAATAQSNDRLMLRYFWGRGVDTCAVQDDGVPSSVHDVASVGVVPAGDGQGFGVVWMDSRTSPMDALGDFHPYFQVVTSLGCGSLPRAAASPEQ
jgi:hypothetical protein